MLRSLSTLFAFVGAATLASSASASPTGHHRGYPSPQVHVKVSAKPYEYARRRDAQRDRCHTPAVRYTPPPAPRHSRWQPPVQRPELVALRHSDRNRDGYVTWEEVIRASQHSFRQADRNRNGVLSRRELAGYTPAFAEDFNRDGHVSSREQRRETRRWFESLDRNRDGVLSSWELRDDAGAKQHNRSQPRLYTSARY